MAKTSTILLALMLAACALAVVSAAEASPEQTSMGRSLGRRLMQSWRGYDPYMWANAGPMGFGGWGFGGPWMWWPGYRMNPHVSAQRMDNAVDRQFARAGW